METVLVSGHLKRRRCEKPLVLRRPVIQWSFTTCIMGPTWGTRSTNSVNHARYTNTTAIWSMQGDKYFDTIILQQPSLLSTEDTALNMTPLNKCSNLLRFRAIPVSTFATAYNRRFNYRRITNEGDAASEVPKTKRRLVFLTQSIYKLILTCLIYHS